MHVIAMVMQTIAQVPNTQQNPYRQLKLTGNSEVKVLWRFLYGELNCILLFFV